MTIRITLISAIVALNSILVGAQDLREIEKKYGERADVYSVSERLWMTPSYDEHGQVCMMRLYPKIVSKNTNYHDTNLDMDESLKFINELFPVNTRGRRISGFGMSDFGGGIVWTRFGYEHVRLVFISSFKLNVSPKQLGGDYVFLDTPIDEAAVTEYRKKEEMKSDDQLIREHASKPKIVEIYWANRKCV